MPKTLNKFCEIISRTDKGSVSNYLHYLERIAKMYGLSLMDYAFDKAYLAMCNRQLELLEI